MKDFVRPGERIAERYTLGREIGRGGMATVFLAHDDRHGRKVALKFLQPDLSASLGVERFKREIGIAAGLSHPHIVPLYDSGEAEGRLYYVMPCVDGVTLRSILHDSGPLTVERALSIARDVGEALAHAHSRGLVHRDVKPSNIMLADDHALVMDFGVAKALDDAGGTLTISGLMVGTPGYMAPEQVTGATEVDHRADIYALGCVAFEMLTGEPPFKSRSVKGKLAHQLANAVPSVSESRPEVPRDIVDAVHRAMAKAPSDRFGTVSEFLEALESHPSWSIASLLPRRLWPTGRGGTRVRLARGFTAALAIAVPAVIALSVFNRGSTDWPNGRPPSVAVLPMETVSTTEEERAAAVAIAEDVTSELGYWESIRAVPSVSLGGPMFDLDLRGPTVGRLDDAMRIGRALGVEAVVTVTARVRGDSIRVQAALFDVGSAGFWQRARSVGRPIEAAGTWNNTLTLVEAVARRVLGLQDQPFTSLAAQRMRSRNPDALLQEDEGRSYLERWQLSEAERSFRRAIELDSTFALAHHRLAQTIYWQHAENPFGRPNAFFEVARSSGIALRFSADLPPRDRDHVRAFHGFQEGDYDAARATYRELLATDPTDVYAWLLLGSVEFVDPWLSSAALQASPRGSWNVAVEAFARAVELQPTFELGYGHIFDVYDAVVGTLDEGLCRGFQVPRGVNIPPWERQTPDNQRLFCLVAPDTIAWLPQAELASMDSVALRRGAEGLLAEATRLLVRWSLYAEDLSKPLEELANATLAERGRLRLASPRLLDSLAVRALGFQANALSRKADTLPDDYFRLASLYLASGRQNDALAAAELGLSSHSATSPGVAPPQEAVNALLATGQLSRALSLLASPAFRRFEPDTALGRFVPYGGAETHLQRLSILGGAMVSGPVLRGEIEAITAIWSGPGYSNRDRELLRRSISLDLALALAFDDEALRAWGEASGPPDPLWAALFAVAENRPDANRLVDNALTATTPRLSEATSRFIRAYLAFRVGRADTALRLLASLDSIPLRADGFEARWAIRGSSLLMTADTYSALGDSASASAYYERFVALWVAGDPLTQPLIERAQRALQVQPRASR